MTDYEGWNRELLAFVKVQDEELKRKGWDGLFLNVLFFLGGALCSWVFQCIMM